MRDLRTRRVLFFSFFFTMTSELAHRFPIIFRMKNNVNVYLKEDRL